MVQHEVISLLLDRGADPSHPRVLLCAMWNAPEALQLQLVLDAGGDPNVATDSDRLGPIFAALRSVWKREVKLRLAADAGPDAQERRRGDGGAERVAADGLGVGPGYRDRSGGETVHGVWVRVWWRVVSLVARGMACQLECVRVVSLQVIGNFRVCQAQA